MVLDGGITAAAFGGLKQVQGNDLPIGGTFNLGANPAASSGQTTLAGLTQGTSTSITGESGEVILQDSAPQLGDLAPGLQRGYTARYGGPRCAWQFRPRQFARDHGGAGRYG